MAGTTFAQQARNREQLALASANLQQVIAAGIVGGQASLAQIGLELSTVIRTQFRPGSGRFYRRGRITHRASAPGRPPAVDTGRLRASYTWAMGRVGRRPFVEVGTNVKYAPFLEFGTRRMRARPHLRPAVLQYRRRIGGVVAQGVRRGEVLRAFQLPKGGLG